MLKHLMLPHILSSDRKDNAMKVTKRTSGVEKFCDGCYLLIAAGQQYMAVTIVVGLIYDRYHLACWEAKHPATTTEGAQP